MKFKFSKNFKNVAFFVVLLLLVGGIMGVSILRLLERRRLIENFDNSDNVIDTIVNTATVSQEILDGIFSEVTDTSVSINKNVETNSLKSTDITTGDLTISGNLMTTDNYLNIGGSMGVSKIDLNEMGVIGDGTSVVLTAQDIKKIASQKIVGGFAINGDGSTIPLIEGRYKLADDGLFNTWANDRWDYVFLYQGWEITLYKDIYSGSTKTITNTNSAILRTDLNSTPIGRNQASSYELKWVGY